MEKIKQALEKARRERGDSPAPAVRGVERSRAAAGAAVKDHIDYTETRTVRVDPAVLRRNRVFNGLGTDPVTAAYKMLRTQVLQRMRPNGWNSLGVVSASSGEGKTLTAVNLAYSLAQEVRHTVLLVDFDLRQPSVHRYFGYQPEHGVEDYLLGDVPLSEILFNPGTEGLVILPAGSPVTNSSELLSSPKVASLVGELKSRYPSRIVMFDLPPVLEVDDALAFFPYIDAALLVVDEGHTRKDALEHALQLLHGVEVVGTVLNKAEVTPTKGYYRP